MQEKPNEKPVMQVIRDLQLGGMVKDPKAQKKYCLLNLFSQDQIAIGGMINIGTKTNPNWYVYEVAKQFADKKEAEDYAKKHSIKLAYEAAVD